MNKSSIITYSSAITLLITTAHLSASLLTIETEAQFEAQVVNNPKPVVVKFAGTWCSVCAEVKEPFAQLAQEPQYAAIDFAQVDVDQLGTVSDRYDISAVPTFIFFQNGQKKLQEVGVKDMATFKDNLDTSLKKAFGQTEPADSALKRANNEPSLLGTVVASLKSAYNSMVGAVSSAWNKLIS